MAQMAIRLAIGSRHTAYYRVVVAVGLLGQPTGTELAPLDLNWNAKSRCADRIATRESQLRGYRHQQHRTKLPQRPRVKPLFP